MRVGGGKLDFNIFFFQFEWEKYGFLRRRLPYPKKPAGPQNEKNFFSLIMNKEKVLFINW